MAEEPQQTLVQKLLFYITAFFILLGTFSLFAFLFLVPFVIEPAFTTIFMEFDEEPAFCVTVQVIKMMGVSNCTWTSCKEGCTKDVYECTQILVNYRISDNSSEWHYTYAKLLPNVKGCGYPPMLNCSVWTKKYVQEGSNFSCYYSRVDPRLVITDLDMWQVYLNLVYAMAIPIPSFIVSVIYLTVAYFYIYNEDPEDGVGRDGDETTPLPLSTPMPPPTSGALTPASEVFREDLASFGHQLKVAMADDLSRESIFTDTVPVSSSNSMNGYVTRFCTFYRLHFFYFFFCRF
ncbi:hypothetical protein AAG570_011301 [Ranatra chinensis]|uniref:Protein tipE n=1 Tax=Ranatra chinensis TaxID=642074 RepID=A0ABD0YK82_9HEMI